jgi:hypothetical protein
MITKTTSSVIVDGPVDLDKIKVDIQPTQDKIKKQAVKIKIVPADQSMVQKIKGIKSPSAQSKAIRNNLEQYK